MIELVRVLIVDDSAYVRKVIRQMLSRSPFLEVVGAARDGNEALEMVEELKPDVITCDLIMPQLDGVGFIRAQMARRRSIRSDLALPLRGSRIRSAAFIACTACAVK